MSAALALALVVATCVQVAEPPRRETRLDAEALRSDLVVLRRAYTELHPGIFRSNTREQVGALFDALDATWEDGRSLREAYLDLSRMLAKLECGHSFANPFNQPESLRHALFEGADRLPFAFRWIDGEMIVTRSAVETEKLVPGTLVRSIDGRSTKEILTALLEFARADGGNDAKRVAQLAVTGEEELEAFDIFFALACPRGSGANVRIEGETPDGKSFELSVATMTAVERNARLTRAKPSAPSDFPFEIEGWSSRRIDGGVAVLRMDTWVAYKTEWDWRAGLNAYVGTLVRDDVHDLVLDLRANEGGNDCGDVLLARRIAEPLELPSYARHVRYRRVPEELDPFLDTWDDSFRDWGDAAKACERAPALLGGKPGEFLRLRRDADDDPGATLSPASGPRFTGRLWVLTSAVNSSATFQFALTVKRTKLGRLVGTTTGGNQRGINGGCFFFVRLPRTGFEVDLPLIASTPCALDGSELTNVPDGGIEPDIAVTTTRADIAAGRDPELAAVLSAIGAARR